MKVTGLITEYNPFHSGHSYHIQRAKALTKADAVVAIMSGDFVQRGAPAIMPKHLRARCALLCGASAVIELPVCYATASAERFAASAVSLLDKLGCVDALCFGSECGEIEVLDEIAETVCEESDSYRAALKDALRSGLSFPLARQQALKTHAPILSSPNNILGIEYLKALKKQKSPIKAYTIRRAGAGYHDRNTEGAYASASAIRAEIHDFQKIAGHLPESCHALIQVAYGKRFPIESNDFSLLLKAKLLLETPESLSAYADVSRELANRIINQRNAFLSIRQFCELLKTKEITYSRISRALFHILLDIKTAQMDDFLASGTVFYARLLGFRESDAALLKRLKETSQIPLISKLPQSPLAERCGNAMLNLDLYASDLYESVVTERFGMPFLNERKKKIVKY